MSSVNYFQGKDGRNSSKVLAPPGGKSNIFGFMGDTSSPAPAQPQRSRQPVSPAPFATSDDGPAKSYKPVSSFNPVTGEPVVSQHGQSPAQSPAQPQTPKQAAQQSPLQQSPLQQSPAGSGAGEAAHTSIKIYNPPGGKSSISF